MKKTSVLGTVLLGTLSSSLIPTGSRIGATGEYCYLGVPFTAFIAKHGTVGQKHTVAGWFIMLDEVAIGLDLLCWLLVVFAVLIGWMLIERLFRIKGAKDNSAE